MTIHELKTDPDVFEATWRGEKRYELRYDDRGFVAGDILHLRETKRSGYVMAAAGEPPEYTGREVKVLVLHILRGPRYGLADGWALLSHTIPMAPNCTMDAERQPVPGTPVIKVEV
ncbi:MAG: DUF3850 domain-containing protein [Thiohalorhabdus sp.]